MSEQHNHAITQIELLTNMRVTTDSYKNLPDLKKQYVFRATQMLFKQCCLKVEEYMGAQSVTAQLGEVQAVRQYDFRKDPTMVLQINQLLELAGMITRQRVGDISPPTGGMPTDPMSPAYFPIGGKPNPVGASGNYITNLVGRDGIDTTLSGNTGIISGVELENKVEDLERDTAANKKVGDDNTARLLKTTPKNERVTLVKAGTNMAFDHTADPKDPTKGTLTLNASGGGISTITGTDGIAVTGSGNSRTVSGKTLNDRVTGHGRDIAANRALANTNSAHLLKITPGDKKVTSIRAGTNMQFDYTPNPNDNTKGTLTANASGGGGGITTITGTNGIAVTGTGTQRQISGKAINDRIPPDLRLWAANSGTNDRLVSNNIHACEFYLGASNHHDKGVIMWEGSAVDVPNRATKEMAR